MTEVTELCRIPKASAFRILETLRSAGYVSKDGNNRYRLTYKLLEVASLARGRDPLRREALPVMEELHRELRETINLGVFEERGVAYVEVLESPHPLRLVPSVGGQACFYATALGKAVAAWLPAETLGRLLQNSKFQKLTPNTITSVREFRRELARIRELGYAVDQEEEAYGCICVGAPIFDVHSCLMGAISASGPTSRMTQTRVNQIGRLLRDACLRVSRRLGFQAEAGIAAAQER
jgi:IclR family acetate operon transcriptional repressor